MQQQRKMRLTHGGHKGTEAAFGQTAERWGVFEVTVSYDGHAMEFSRNVQELADAELEKGHVSMEFVFQTLGRRFAHPQSIRRVIYSMFHIVTRGDELFAIGWIQPDGTVKGGTGWGVELAKSFNRRVHVFDQDRNAWFTWNEGKWDEGVPVLPDGPFSATGTRSLSEAGRNAIEQLFERSLGQAVAEKAANTAV